MKRQTLLALAAAALTTVPVAAQQWATPNAAVDYWRAAHWAASKAIGQEGAFSINWEQVGDNLDPAKMPKDWQSSRAFVDELAINDFLIGSQREHCNFQFDLESGPHTMLPHLGVLRNLSRHARFDARDKLIHGKPDEAAQRIGAIFRASRHVAADGLLISSLVGAAMAGQAAKEAELMVASGRLTATGREILLSSLGNPDDPDPFNFLGAIEGERTILLEWVRRSFTGPDAAPRFAAEAAPMLATDQTQAPLIQAISIMDEGQFQAALGQLSDYYTQMLAAWTSDAPVSNLTAIERKNSSGDFGPLGVILAPALIKARESAERAADQRAQILKKLRDYTPATPAPARR